MARRRAIVAAPKSESARNLAPVSVGLLTSNQFGMVGRLFAEFGDDEKRRLNHGNQNNNNNSGGGGEKKLER